MSVARTTRRLLPLVALTACVTAGLGESSFPPDSAVRPAADVPARFEPLDPAARLAEGDTITGVSCRSPMVDPRDGMPLRLVRSAEGRGDYEARNGRYGTGTSGLLRLDCNTGRALGVVPR
ncbi:MAG TPA: hypothetical protein VFS08_12880 [Gemmatimonadaceae bacterium]|nr:hypothetical protein [Gemmatimonadaceae bacterium]